ncbi:MAG TPA: Crp/Fnr family transcriptional regulator [Fodinibius sp.]|nr:Crp/Fnr family transcriptional regulator [Fodinibius sp.]
MMKNNKELYDQLRTTLKQWVDLPDAQWNELAAIFHPKTVAKDDYLLHTGDEVYELYYVGEGLLRIYYLNERGKESNKAFPAQGGFAGPLATALLKMPSRYGIQALEDSVLLTTQYDDYFNLLDQHPLFDRLGRKILEWLLGRRELREQSLLQQSAKERYLDFIERYSSLLNRIPQYHIASYLGITDVSLSRLRSELSSDGY